MNTLSTHILDTSVGLPAAGIRVTLERDGEVIGHGISDDDGRVKDLASREAPLSPGTYQLSFEVGEYFSRTGRESFYSIIPVRVDLHGADEHHHVPLLLSPFGYSTYRGS